MDEVTADIFKMKLGQLKAKARAQVNLTYIMEVPIEDTFAKLTIPTTIAPRYIPPTDDSSVAEEIANIGYKNHFDPQTPFDIHIEITMNGAPEDIFCLSHNLVMTQEEQLGDSGQCTTTMALTNSTTAVMDKDILVYYKTQLDNDKPNVFVEKSEESLAAMVSMVPTIELKEHKAELIFLVDRSASMKGEGMNMTRKALHFFLHSLPTDCYFNIVSFGSAFSYLFANGSTKYQDRTLRAAKTHVDNMRANYGGTEIHAPLTSVLSQPPISGYAKQIILLTDGSVSNADQVIGLVRDHKHLCRVFALGLSSSASRHLVKGVARVGNGTCLFSTLNEDLRSKVVSLLKNALMPALTDLEIFWNVIDKQQQPKRYVDKLAGERSAIFAGARMLDFKIFDKDETLETVDIFARGPSGCQRNTIHITEKNDLKSGNVVHQMAARRRIQEIEEKYTGIFSLQFPDGDPSPESLLKLSAKKEITRLGLKFGLVTKYTSFVGVDKRSETPLFEGVMLTRHIHQEFPLMWDVAGGAWQTDCWMNDSADAVDSSMPHSRKGHVTSSSVAKHDELSDIIGLQQANGSFKMDKVLEKLFGMDEQTLKNTSPTQTHLDVWVTTLCRVFIETKYIKEKDCWTFVVEKAIKYLTNKCSENELDYAHILDKAKELVKTLNH